MYAVFRDSHSHCCIRVSERNGVVEYIALQEDAGELLTDLLKMNAKEFYRTFNHELTNYPLRRAAHNYLNPLTPAIKITGKARQHLQKIMESKHMNDKVTEVAEAAVVVDGRKSRAERNIEQTEKASVKTNNKVHEPPAPAPVKVTGDVEAATTKKKRGTWDKEETTAERNQRAMSKARKEREEQKQKEAKKAERKAAKAASKSDTTSATPANNRNTNSKDNTVNTKTTKNTKPAKTEKSPTKNETTAKAKLVKPAAVKEAPAKKAAPKTEKAAPAKKLAKGTGKAAAKSAPVKAEKAPAKKAGKVEKAKAGRRSSFDESAKITILVKENPKREGSEAYNTFELLRKSKTVGDFFAKGGGSANLRWNIDREYIKVG